MLRFPFFVCVVQEKHIGASPFPWEIRSQLFSTLSPGRALGGNWIQVGFPTQRIVTLGRPPLKSLLNSYSSYLCEWIECPSHPGAKTLIAAFSSWVEASSIDSSGDYENQPLPPSRGDWIQQLHVASPPVALVCSLMRSSSLAVFRPPLNWLASSYKKLQASRFHPSSGPETHWPSNPQVEIKFLQYHLRYF